MDIEDCHLSKNYCTACKRYCQYTLGKNCIHPIHNYILYKVQNSNSNILNTKYDLDYNFSINEINKIINLIYTLDIFDYNLLFSSIYYLEYFIKKTKICIHSKNIYTIWFLSIMISNKFINDIPYSNKTYSMLFNVDLKFLNNLEIEFLRDINFSLLKKNLSTNIQKIKQEITLFQIQSVCDSVVPFKDWNKFQNRYHSNLF
jgi:hypothetical protein